VPKGIGLHHHDGEYDVPKMMQGGMMEMMQGGMSMGGMLQGGGMMMGQMQRTMVLMGPDGNPITDEDVIAMMKEVQSNPERMNEFMMDPEKRQKLIEAGVVTMQ